jgi:site-specific DNA recombinase
LVRSRIIHAVIVYELDRLSRRLGHQLLLSEECERAEVALLVVSSPIEATPEGAFLVHMKGAMSEYERAKILERTRRGHLGRARAGHPHGGQVPLGYRYVSVPHGGYWQIDEEEAALVRRIFRMCVEGVSVWMIASRLTQERMPTKRDRDRTTGTGKRAAKGVWSKSSVLAVLRYEGYTGRAYYGKWQTRTATRRTPRPREEWVEFAIPPIIEMELFKIAHEHLRRNQARATRNGKIPYLLGGGRLRCARCGSTMTGYRITSGSRRYQCSGMTRIDVSERCYATTKAEPLEDRVWAVVNLMLEHPEMVAAMVGLKHASNDEKRAELQMEIEARDRALAECDRQEKRLLEVYVADEAMELKDLLGAHHREINTRRQQLRTEQRDLRQQLDDLHQDDARAEEAAHLHVRGEAPGTGRV